MKLEEIKRIVSSNEFLGLSSGDHLNMIDTLLDLIEELKIFAMECDADNRCIQPYEILGRLNS